MTAQSRYTALEADRSEYTASAEQASKVTNPTVFPEGTTSSRKIPKLYQSVGAYAVNNLAAKLLLALFPPGAAFFKLSVDTFVQDQLAEAAGGDDPTGEIEEGLSKVERAVMTRFEQGGSRAVLFNALKHLIVAGNYLLEVLPKGKLKGHSLKAYVVKRDLEGNLMEIIVKECLSRDSLSAELKAHLASEHAEHNEYPEETEDIDVFTRVCRTTLDGRWDAYQEIEGVIVPGSKAHYPSEKCPFLPLRFIAIAGEDYGHGYVEEYLGDLLSLESLRMSMVDFAAIAAKILILVDESGYVTKKKIQDAPNGAIIDGKAGDISFLTLEKYADFQVAKAVHDDIKASIERAFLSTSSVQRQAERVTAEEIRIVAGELEQTLGGIYSVQAQELQLPLVRLLMAQLQREGVLPNLPEGMVSPQIVTGLEGLGRNTEGQRLTAFVQDLAQTFGPAVVSEYLNPEAFMKRKGASLGIDIKGLVRPDSEVQQMRQQQQQAELAAKLVPAGVQAGVSLNSQTPQA